jgi:putative spermidine/putrescine transport system substrate-binding protein/spermidine/putrescine transport system substrate-binding protein
MIARRLSRPDVRRPIRALMLALLAAGLSLSGARPAAAGGSINLLAWEGYAQKPVFDAFTAATGCRVSATYAGSNDEMAAKVMSGTSGSIDLISPSNDVTQLLIRSGKIAELDMRKLPHVAEFYPILRAPAWLVSHGKQYGVAYAYGFFSFILTKNALPEKPTSLKVMWDPRLAGRLVMDDDPETMYEVARYLGIKDVYNMSDQELDRAAAETVRMKPNIIKFWSNVSDATDMITSGAAVGGNLVTDGVYRLWSAGIRDLIEVDPTNRGGYVDNWMVVKGSETNPCVYQWLDWSSQARNQARGAEVTGLGYANAGTFALLAPPFQQFLRHYGLDDPAAIAKTDWWQPVAHRSHYQEVWAAVKAAD